MSVVFGVGALASRHGATVDQVKYILRTRDVMPIGRAGNARVYDNAAAEFVGAELARIAERNAAKGLCGAAR